MEFMSDLMFSHYTMVKWHFERQAYPLCYKLITLIDDYRKEESTTTFADIAAAMGTFKKTMWDTMQKLVTHIMSSTNLTLYQVEDFIKVRPIVIFFLR